MNLMDAKKIHKVVSPSTQKSIVVLMLMLEYSKFWLMWILGFVDRSDLNLSHKLNKCFLAFALLALTSKSNPSFCSLCWWIESVIYPAFVWRLKRLSLTDLISIIFYFFFTISCCCNANFLPAEDPSISTFNAWRISSFELPNLNFQASVWFWAILAN